MIVESIFSLSRGNKKILLISIDLMIIVFAYGVSSLFPEGWNDAVSVILICIFETVILTTVLFWVGGFYTTVIRFLGVKQLAKILIYSELAAVIYVFVRQFNNVSTEIGSIAIYVAITASLVIFSRISIVELYGLVTNSALSRVLIYGAGRREVQLLQILQNSNEYHVVSIVDEDRNLHGLNVKGHKVEDANRLVELVKSKFIEHVFLVEPFLYKKKEELIKRMSPFPVRVKALPFPSYGPNKNENNHLDYQVFDACVKGVCSDGAEQHDLQLLERCVKGKVVLVAGAGSCMGAELSRQLIKYSPLHLVLIESSDAGLSRIDSEIQEISEVKSGKVKVTALLRSSLNKVILRRIFEIYKVETIYQSGSIVDISMAEFNFIETVRRNVLDVKAYAEAACEAQVENFILLSSGEAVRPEGIMGATRRLAEQVIQSIAYEGKRTRFCAVRYGNVLVPNRSFISTIQRQIKDLEVVTIAHPNLTRYFLAGNDAALLIIQAGALAEKGEVFILDMGEPVRVLDIVKKVISYMGLIIRSKDCPNGDIEIRYDGLKPGEKLIEELSTGDNPWGTGHPRIMVADEFVPEWKHTEFVLEELRDACERYDCEAIRVLLNKHAGYSGSTQIFDFQWNEKKSFFSSPRNVVKKFTPFKDPRSVPS